MSELQEIEVFIEPNGTVRVEVRGAQGKQCMAITKRMEQLLGGKVLNRDFTHEYDQESVEETEKDWLKATT